MRRRRWLRMIGPLTLLVLGGVYALASLDWCGVWQSQPPGLIGMGMAEGPLLAGAARVEVRLSFPVGLAGYSPPRPQVRRAAQPVAARALVIECGGVKVGLASLDLLTLPAPLVDAVRSRTGTLGLGALWLGATHTHTSLGGYDESLVAQLAGTGRYRPEVRDALVDAVVGALEQAAAARVPVSLEVARGGLGELVVPRSGERVDPRFWRVGLVEGQRRVGELVVASAHPTLAPRRTDALEPDWPGRLARLREQEGGVVLVLQGAVGNAMAQPPEDAREPEGYARRLLERLGTAPAEAVERPSLGYARAQVTLPRPDASRLVPGYLRAVGDNVLCQAAPRSAELSVLRLGPLRLLALPGEPTAEAAKRLEAAVPGAAVVSLTNGYLGYVESPERFPDGSGEARRQLFGKGLLEVLAQGASVVGEPLSAR